MSSRSRRQEVTTAVPTRRSARISAREPVSNHSVAGCEATQPELNPNCLTSRAISTTHEGETGYHQFGGFDSAGTLKNTGFTWRSQHNDTPKTRRNTTANACIYDGDAMAYITKTATAEDRKSWKGWCEIESEPAFFNVMLRDFGVGGIKVQEILSLEDEMLASLPKPVYGLIFLFQFKEDDPTKQEASCPDHVWFANQTTSNACASIALLNIIMNISDIELGPSLQSLKDFTATMEPAVRGYQICNHDFIRVIHNSFARKMDMLNADLALSNEANSKKLKLKKRAASQEYQDQPGFHFIAFVPIEGNVWKLDGLERQPMNLGKYENDWMQLARPIIKERMDEYEGDQIQFNLLSLCKNPLLTIPKQLALNVNSLNTVEKRLSHFQPDWKSFAEDPCKILYGPSSTFRLTPELLDMTKPEALNEPENPSVTAASLIEMRAQLLSAQFRLQTAILDEVAAEEQDKRRAANRRHDYTPIIYTWVKFLAENGTLQGLVEKADQERERF